MSTEIHITLKAIEPDWHAQMDTEPRLVGIGQTPDEAVCSLFRQIRDREFLKWYRELEPGHLRSEVA